MKTAMTLIIAKQASDKAMEAAAEAEEKFGKLKLDARRKTLCADIHKAEDQHRGATTIVPLALYGHRVWVGLVVLFVVAVCRPTSCRSGKKGGRPRKPSAWRRAKISNAAYRNVFQKAPSKQVGQMEATVRKSNITLSRHFVVQQMVEVVSLSTP